MYGNLKAEMARRDLTMTDVGQMCGMSLQKISRRFQGKIPFSVDEAVEIRDKMGLEDMRVEILFKKEA